MKELSIEEKAKAYDEAIKRMQSYVVDEYGCTRIKVVNVFPELAESEGERIRKDLIIYLRSVLSNKKYGDKFIESWIAWLEKQGEQKPINSQFTPEQADILDKHIDKFLEQKSTWSEEDTQYINDTLALLSFGCSIHSVGEVQEWLQSLNNRVQLKQEWNEEDENRINRLIAYFEDKESFTAEDDVVYANWLKSLKDRYTWKPNDEQMNALRYVTNFDYGGHKATLVSLYEQLKKL